MSLGRAAGAPAERAPALCRHTPDEASSGGTGPAPASYSRLYALVIAALAGDIALLVWLTERWK